MPYNFVASSGILPLVTPAFQYIAYAVLVVISMIATYTDLRTRRIPNWLTLPAICFGLAFNLVVDGGPGLLASLASVALCGGVFFALFLLGGMGAGDVKMMTAVAAIASWPMSVYALMYTAIAGGFMAFAVLIFKGRLGKTFRRMVSLKTYRDAKTDADAEDEKDQRDIKDPKDTERAAAPAGDPDRIYIPYGPAIAAGTILSMIL